MATGQWWILKCLRIAQAEDRHWKSEMDNFLMILIVPNILLLGLACQSCCLEDPSGPNYPSPRVQHPRWDARSWQWEKRKREGVCRLPKECMWRWNSRRWYGVTETGERKQTVKSPYKQQGKWNLVSHWVQYLYTWITCPYELNVIMIVATLACAFTWLPCHETDLKLNTKAFAATYYAY